MALYDNPPHRVSSYSNTGGTDSGGGVQITYTLLQASIPCVINTVSGTEAALFAQQGLNVSHTVAFLSDDLTTALARGMKLVSDDDSASYHIVGLRKGREMGGVPAFTYAQCQEIL